VLVDLHSYPVKALPYERHQDATRPPVCLGVDPDHTPAALVERATRACTAIGQVIINDPRARPDHVMIRQHAEMSKAARAVRSAQATLVSTSGLERAAGLFDVSSKALRSAVKESSQDTNVQDTDVQAMSAKTPEATAAPTIAPTTT
jgi:hypothetical protein